MAANPAAFYETAHDSVTVDGGFARNRQRRIPVKKSEKQTAGKRRSRAKKWLMGGMLAFVLVIAAVIVCMLTRLDAIVKAAIEKYGSAATATAVRVESVKIRLKQGSGAIRGLTIANPDGILKIGMPVAVKIQ